MSPKKRVLQSQSASKKSALVRSSPNIDDHDDNDENDENESLNEEESSIINNQTTNLPISAAPATDLTSISRNSIS